MATYLRVAHWFLMILLILVLVVIVSTIYNLNTGTDSRGMEALVLKLTGLVALYLALGIGCGLFLTHRSSAWSLPRLRLGVALHFLIFTGPSSFYLLRLLPELFL